MHDKFIYLFKNLIFRLKIQNKSQIDFKWSQVKFGVKLKVIFLIEYL